MDRIETIRTVELLPALTRSEFLRNFDLAMAHLALPQEEVNAAYNQRRKEVGFSILSPELSEDLAYLYLAEERGMYDMDAVEPDRAWEENLAWWDHSRNFHLHADNAATKQDYDDDDAEKAWEAPGCERDTELLAVHFISDINVWHEAVTEIWDDFEARFPANDDSLLQGSDFPPEEEVAKVWREAGLEWDTENSLCPHCGEGADLYDGQYCENCGFTTDGTCGFCDQPKSKHNGFLCPPAAHKQDDWCDECGARKVEHGLDGAFIICPGSGPLKYPAWGR